MPVCHVVGGIPAHVAFGARAGSGAGRDGRHAAYPGVWRGAPAWPASGRHLRPHPGQRCSRARGCCTSACSADLEGVPSPASARPVGLVGLFGALRDCGHAGPRVAVVDTGCGAWLRAGGALRTPARPARAPGTRRSGPSMQRPPPRRSGRTGQIARRASAPPPRSRSLHRGRIPGPTGSSGSNGSTKRNAGTAISGEEGSRRCSSGPRAPRRRAARAGD